MRWGRDTDAPTTTFFCFLLPSTPFWSHHIVTFFLSSKFPVRIHKFHFLVSPLNPLLLIHLSLEIFQPIQVTMSYNTLVTNDGTLHPSCLWTSISIDFLLSVLKHAIFNFTNSLQVFPFDTYFLFIMFWFVLIKEKFVEIESSCLKAYHLTSPYLFNWGRILSALHSSRYVVFLWRCSMFRYRCSFTGDTLLQCE